ncbi:MAG: hypothetical protein AB7U79_07245 [Candidatus Izemoplasmatales bacterium]
MSALTLWLAQPLAAGANAILNEFENEILWDNDTERFSWAGVAYDASAYTIANILTKVTNDFFTGKGVVQWNEYLVAGIYDSLIYSYGDRYKDYFLAKIWR